MVNTSAGNLDTKVDEQPTMLPEQMPEMINRTPWPNNPASTP
jgi:hypothetical protein